MAWENKQMKQHKARLYRRVLARLQFNIFPNYSSLFCANFPIKANSRQK